MDKLIIIGASKFQYSLIKKAKQLGYETHVFAWEKGAVAKEISDYFYPISITKKEEILKYAYEIDPVGICSIGSDLAVPTVNYIANELNLVGNSLKCSTLTTNKYEMKKALRENHIITADFQFVKSEKDLNFINYEFPIIVKPIDRSGSRGVSKVNDLRQLKKAFAEAKEISFKESVIIENYVEGPEYSIEMISQNGRHHFLQLTRKFTTGSPDFIEHAHLAPAKIKNNLKLKIINKVKKVLDILEIKNGASHSEFKINNTGDINIIEVGSRMGGDFIGSDMVKITTGIDFVEKVIDISVNKNINLNGFETNNIALVKFILFKNDIKKFNLIKNKYSNLILSSNVKSINNNDLNDSSSRNGYYILNIESEILKEDILKIIGLN